MEPVNINTSNSDAENKMRFSIIENSHFTFKDNKRSDDSNLEDGNDGGMRDGWLDGGMVEGLVDG